MSKNSSEKYPLVMRILHWLMALALITMIAVGVWMTDLEKEDPIRGLVYSIHKSTGALILLLAIIRLGIRSVSKIPPMPKGIPANIKIGAHAAHYLLYILMIAIPVAGIGLSNSFGHPVSIFNLVELPKIFPDNREVGEFMGEAHELLAYSLLAVVILHALGAIKHRFFEKPENDVLKRML